MINEWKIVVLAISIVAIIASCDVQTKQAKEKTAQEAIKAGYEQKVFNPGLNGCIEIIWVKKNQPEIEKP